MRRGGQMENNTSVLMNKLVQEGASKKLASFICRLNEDLSLINPSKKIDLVDHKLFIFEENSPLAVIGFLGKINNTISFIYDSRHFDEYGSTARTVFSQLFAEDYERLLQSGDDREIPASLIHEFHYFVAKLNRFGNVLEVELYSKDSELLAMLSDIPKEAVLADRNNTADSGLN
ncbi:MAG: hypothetical protein QXS93_02115 [Candidatus Micrarchaeia archaeon]